MTSASCKRSYITITTILLFVFYFSVQAQELTWVTAEGTATMKVFTKEEARKLAVQAAEKAAVEQVVSEDVSAETLLVNLKLSGNIIGAIPFGKVMEKTILEEGIINIRIKGQDALVPVYKVKIRAGVSEETDGVDPEFRLNASLNKTRFKNNEEMRLRIKPTKACYVSIFNILEDEKILRLIPSQYKPYNRVEADELFYFPDNIDRSKGVALTAQTPQGKNIVSESFLILGLKQPTDLEPENIKEAVFGENINQTAFMKDLIKDLASIPLDQRGEELIHYEIKK